MSCKKEGANDTLAMKGGLHMNQVKIGSFLKKLRNEKGLTQEQLAEQLNVSNLGLICNCHNNNYGNYN